MKYYCGFRFRRKDGYYAVVYHWERDNQVTDIQSDFFDTAEKAVDAVVQEAKDRDLEPLEME